MSDLFGLLLGGIFLTSTGVALAVGSKSDMGPRITIAAIFLSSGILLTVGSIILSIFSLLTLGWGAKW